MDMNQRKPFVAPEADVVLFDTEDIITMSATCYTHADTNEDGVCESCGLPAL